MIKGLKELTSRVCVVQVVGAMSQCYLDMVHNIYGLCLGSMV
jgi:hypothetical protein